MKILGIIPARFASTRFPGKPLINISGKSMVRRVYEQAKQSTKLHKVIVATDDERIYDEVTSFGGEVMMTGSQHINGTERCIEVIKSLQGAYDYAINVQGDEPFIKPEMIDELAAILDGQTELGTLVKKITDPDALDNPNTMKVAFTKNHEALY
ncbi:MAG: NTP transferase domain-containing protein, partial [Cyclobacteriaceae bacterium]